MKPADGSGRVSLPSSVSLENELVLFVVQKPNLLQKFKLPWWQRQVAADEADFTFLCLHEDEVPAG